MHQLHCFPSRTMAIYVGRMFLIRTFSIMFALVLVLQTLDLLGESGKILAVAGNGDSDVWRYVGMRMPQIIATFMPFSVLLGRSEARRVGEACVSTCRSRWAKDKLKNKQ